MVRAETHGLVLAALAGVLLAGCSGERDVQRQLDRGTGAVQLPPGETVLTRGLVLPPGSDGLEITGSANTVLKAAETFREPALISCDGCRNLKLRNFRIDGNRSAVARPAGIPPSNETFARFYMGSGIVIENCENVEIRDVRFTGMAGMAVIANATSKIVVDHIEVNQSGSLNANGRNNTTGGVLFENGTNGFEVRNGIFRNIRGNAVWTHSRYGSPRNRDGLITRNTFEIIGRDAIQVGHATRVRVDSNSGKSIGYPVETVDIESAAIPVAIDTAGDVDESVYANNSFAEINGKCIDLDGFHDGEVTANTCVNRGAPGDYPHGQFAIVLNNNNPDMQSRNIAIRNNVIDGSVYGAIFLIGSGHQVTGNRLLNLNQAQCPDGRPGGAPSCRYADYGLEEPSLLNAGIFLAWKVLRPAPAETILVEDNEITGYRMDEFCIVSSPHIEAKRNTVRKNRCIDTRP
jgi:hypothetical protein